MKSDSFWEKFWLTFCGVMLLVACSSIGLFVVHIRNINAAAVGISYDASKDPFASPTLQANLSLTNGYAYRDSLPLGARQWSWDALLGWNSGGEVFDGSSALSINFTAPWGGMGMSGFSISRSQYQSISLAVYPDASVGDLYIELYDAKGNAMGRQSIGWYAKDNVLVPNEWQQISIPFSNLLGSSSTQTVSGFSINTTNPGIAYIDSVQFISGGTAHTLWVSPVSFDGPPFNPFATSTPFALPYTASFSEDDFSHWYSYYGLFAERNQSFKIGPIGANTDSVAVFRGGRGWSDYQVNTTLDWGITSVFSLLVRVTDSSNFVSCAFSHYGQTAQIYLVKNGVSTQLGQSPGLAIDDMSPWQDVSVGAVVQGDRVSCLVKGEKVLSADISNASHAGSVGFEAWDPNTSSSPHTIKQFEVRPLLGE